MGPRRHPRAVPGTAQPGQSDQGRNPASLRAPRLEELLELGVVERRAGQRPADVLRDVVVTEGDRVGVAVGALPDLGTGPDPDPRDAAQAPVGLLVAERNGALEALGLKVTPSVANFVLIHFPDVDGKRAPEADEFLTSRGYILRAVKGYGFPNALRMSIGPEEANRGVIEALGEFMGRKS